VTPAAERPIVVPERQRAVGERNRAGVEHWHEPLAIARRLKAAYEEILSG
jgi:hypothetical protein